MGLTVCGESSKNGKTRHITLNTKTQDIVHKWQAQTDRRCPTAGIPARLAKGYE